MLQTKINLTHNICFYNLQVATKRAEKLFILPNTFRTYTPFDLCLCSCRHQNHKQSHCQNRKKSRGETVVEVIVETLNKDVNKTINKQNRLQNCEQSRPVEFVVKTVKKYIVVETLNNVVTVTVALNSLICCENERRIYLET